MATSAAAYNFFSTTTAFLTSTSSSSSSECDSLTVDDGGLILTATLDLIIALILIGFNYVFWEWWVDMKQEEAAKIEVRAMSPDDSSSTGSTETAPSPMEKVDSEKETLKWYKFYYQVLKTKDLVLQRKHGDDGILYIHFTEDLTLLMLILCVLSCAIILPINMLGHQDLLWFHTILAPLYLLIASIIMEAFRSELEVEAPVEVDQAIVIEGTDMNRLDMVKYLEAVGMGDDMVDIQHVYDVEKLYDLLQDKKYASRMELRYKDKHFEEPDEVHQIASEGCLCCLAVEEPAVMYYEQQRLELEQRFEEERRLARSKRVDKTIVVWNSGDDSQRFLNLHKPTQIHKLLKKPLTRASVWWGVSKAPLHYDINWENYAMGQVRWWSRAILINLVVLFIVLFFTTPVVIVQFLYTLFFVDESDSDSSSSDSTTFWSDYATILLLLVLEAILPQIVNQSCTLERHRTQTHRNSWCLWKVFIYLLISELFMPAFGYSSLASLLETYTSDLENSEGLDSLWECVFSSYTSAFFCKLLISGALIGRSLELINPEGILRYYYYLMESETKREYKMVFLKMRDAFNIGYNYGKLVAFSAISITFSIICPLITIFGLLFVCCKYSVDKYLMIYFHKRCGSYGPKTHKDATTYVVFSACLLQFFMLIFDLIYIGLYNNKTIFAICVLMFIIAVWIYGWWEAFMVYLFPQKPTSDAFGRLPDTSQLVDVYIPKYLKPKSTSEIATTNRITVKPVDYGTMRHSDTPSSSVPSLYPQPPSPIDESLINPYRK